MIGLAVALSLAFAPAARGANDLGVRMRASAAAAQALQGPLDGTWTLWDAHRRPLFEFQITDPAGGGPLGGAWRRPWPSAPAALIAAIARRGDHLTIYLAGDGETAGIRLYRRGDGAWSGEATGNGRPFPVTLRRSAFDATAR